MLRNRSVAGLFGFAHSRRLALQALAVSAEYAAEGEVHGVFAGYDYFVSINY